MTPGAVPALEKLPLLWEPVRQVRTAKCTIMSLCTGCQTEWVALRRGFRGVSGAGDTMPGQGRLIVGSSAQFEAGRGRMLGCELRGKGEAVADQGQAR